MDHYGTDRSAEVALHGVEIGARYSRFHVRGNVSFGWFVGLGAGPAWGTYRSEAIPFGFPMDRRSSATHESVRQLTGAAEGGAILFVAPLFVSAGVGLQYTTSDADPQGVCRDADSDSYCIFDGMHLVYGAGVAPRILFSVGAAL